MKKKEKSLKISIPHTILILKSEYRAWYQQQMYPRPKYREEHEFCGLDGLSPKAESQMSHFNDF